MIRFLALPVLAVVCLAAPAQADHKFLPNNSDAVIVINVKQILGSAALKDSVGQAMQLLQNEPQAKQILEQLGFDPFQDLERIIIAGSGGGPDQALVLLQGKFNVGKFADLAEKAAGQERNLKILKEGAHTLYEIQIPRGQVQQAYLALLDGTTIVLGPNKELIVDTLNKKAGKKETTQKKELLQLLDKSDPNQSVSLVVLQSSFQAVPSPELEKVSSIGGGLTLTDELKAELIVTAKTVEDARELGDKARERLNQFKALVNLAAGNNPRIAPLADFLGGVTVNAKDSAIVIRGRVTKEIIEELMKLRDLR